MNVCLQRKSFVQLGGSRTLMGMPTRAVSSTQYPYEPQEVCCWMILMNPDKKVQCV